MSPKEGSVFSLDASSRITLALTLMISMELKKLNLILYKCGFEAKLSQNLNSESYKRN